MWGGGSSWLECDGGIERGRRNSGRGESDGGGGGGGGDGWVWLIQVACSSNCSSFCRGMWEWLARLFCATHTTYHYENLD